MSHAFSRAFFGMLCRLSLQVAIHTKHVEHEVRITGTELPGPAENALCRSAPYLLLLLLLLFLVFFSLALFFVGFFGIA